ncbi:MAG: hypothetical protein ABR592_06135 [Nitriliruptorales bacterium]
MPEQYGGFPTKSNIFVQVIQGSVRDREEARRTWERWATEIAPEGIGWLASTAGFSDGEFIAVVTFASGEAVRRNSQRPEQDEWWREMERHFSGDVTIQDCETVATYGAWERQDAGFVQIIQGWSRDLDGMMDEIAKTEQEFVRDHQLGLVGGIIADHGDGNFTEVIYYPTEDDARAADQEEAQKPVGAAEKLSQTASDIRYLFLRDPMLHHHV